jgi:methylamine dehydrogenase heavy chain
MRVTVARMVIRTFWVVLCSVGINSTGVAAVHLQVVPGAAPVVVLPSPQLHWVYILNLSSSLVVTNVLVVNGDTGKMLGTITSGYLADFVESPRGRTIYMSETYYSRAARGKRTDLITAYDPHTLTPIRETLLPNGRFMSPGKKYALSLSVNGHYLFSANMRPKFSVSVIDLERFEFVREISTPGCALAYPTGDASFAAICGSGALMNVSLRRSGKLGKTFTRPFFNPGSDPVFDAPAIVHGSNVFYFVSYHGWVYPVKRTHGEAVPERAWDIVNPTERRLRWRPGGYYQLLALNPALHRLYVLMHQGGAWSQKQSGTQVWVIDTRSGRVVARDPLVKPADAISVTLDRKPLLFAIKDGTLEVYRFERDVLEHLREVTRLGTEASYMSVPGEG